MNTLKLLVIISLALAAATPSLATDIAVGSCKPSLKSYGTISEAVTAAAALHNPTIFVCPGTYTEQVVISTPLTLQGVSVPPADNPTINPPATFSASANQPTQQLGTGNPVAPLILADTPFGAVVIQDIAVDGAGYCTSDYSTPAGIVYLNTPGRVSYSVVRNMGCSSGVGIGVENDLSSPVTVTLANSVVQGNPNVIGPAVVGDTQSGSPLTLNTEGNILGGAPEGLSQGSGVGGSDTGNLISASLYGVIDRGTNSTYSGNTIVINSYGVLIAGGAPTFTGNTLAAATPGATDGFNVISSSGATIESNTITGVSNGIELNGNTVHLGPNAIGDVKIGVDNVPASGPKVVGTFFDVNTISTTFP